MQTSETQQVQQSVAGKTGCQSQRELIKLDPFYERAFYAAEADTSCEHAVTQQRGTK